MASISHSQVRDAIRIDHVCSYHGTVWLSIKEGRPERRGQEIDGQEWVRGTRYPLAPSVLGPSWAALVETRAVYMEKGSGEESASFLSASGLGQLISLSPCLRFFICKRE